MVESTQARFPEEGFLNQAEHDRKQSVGFTAMRRQHPAVESVIDHLEHRGLNRVSAFGVDGFTRVVALSVLALNVHRVDLLLRRKARRR